jgi:hypothetical protein
MGLIKTMWITISQNKQKMRTTMTSLSNQSSKTSNYSLFSRKTTRSFPNMRFCSKTKILPNAPEKILDAPDLRDDYYLNLIDWGDNDIISISLANSLYLLQSNGETQNLMTLENNFDYISSVSWMKKTNCLAVGLSNS